MTLQLSFVGSRLACALFGVAALLCSCTDPVQRSQVTVSIDADESVRELIRYVDVEVRSGPQTADPWEVQVTRTLTPRNGWPLHFSFPRPESSGLVGYLVIASAKGADDHTITVVQARSEYVRGKSIELQLTFDEACMKRSKLCPTTFSCRQGECIDPFVPASELPVTSEASADKPAPMREPDEAGSKSSAPSQTGSAGSPASMPSAAAGGCSGSNCPSMACAARDPQGACLPCPAGFLGKDAASCSPALISLLPNTGKLSPAFEPATSDYEISVGLLTERVGLMLEAPAGTDVLVNGRSLEGKSSWTSAVLALGETNVVVTLMAKGGLSRTYTLTVKRSGAQLGAIMSPYPSAGDAFGTNLAISGDLIIVGAPYEDGSEAKPAGDPNEAAMDSGAAYLFERTDSGWVSRAYLKAENPRAGQHFGYNVTVDGKRFAVGVRDDAGGGSVYVYEYDLGNVKPVAILHGDGPEGAAFGRSLRLKGDRLVVGCPSSDEGANGSGSLYVFDYDGSAWQRSAVLHSETPGPLDWLGSHVDFDGDIVVGGATGRTVAGQQLPSGVVYVFERGESGWKQVAMLQPTEVEPGAFFGEFVSILGTTIATGGFFGTAGLSGGTAYVFTRGSDGQWSQQVALKPNNTRAGDCFGERVLLITPELLLIGADHESSAMPGIGADGSGTLDSSGSLFLFSKSSGSWKQALQIKLDMPVAQQEFGLGLAASADGTFIAGVPADPNRNGSSKQPGGVFVFQ